MKKGFTLIELLAVIVILAIIALIATPIILGIINNAKKESDKRSVELYVKAAELAVARENLKGEFKPTTCEVTGGVCMCEGYADPLNVEMDNASDINGTITFNEKGVVTSNTLEVLKGGTTEDPTPVGEQYLFQWFIGEKVEGPTIGNTINLSNYTEDNGFLYSTTAPDDKTYYNKLKIEDNVVTEVYVCAILEGTEWCIQGGSSSYYGLEDGEDSTGNVKEIRNIQKANQSYYCEFDAINSYCSYGSVTLEAGKINGFLSGNDGNGSCNAYSNGSSYCGTK